MSNNRKQYTKFILVAGVIGVIAALLLVRGALLPPASSEPSVWPQFGRTPEGNSRANSRGPANPKVAWVFTHQAEFAKGHVGSVWLAPPVIDRKGFLYLGSQAGSIFKLNPVDGSTIWEKKVAAPYPRPDFLFAFFDAEPGPDFGDASITASAAIVDSDTVVFPTGSDFLLALDQNGNELWRFRKPGYAFENHITVDNERKRLYTIAHRYAITTTRQPIHSTLLAIDFSGNLIAEYAPPGDITLNNYPAVDVITGHLFINADTGGITALDTTLQPLWIFNQFDFHPVGGGKFSYPVIGNDGAILFAFGPQGIPGNCSDEKATLYALDPDTGALKWKQAVGCSEGQPAIGHDGTIYVGSTFGGYLPCPNPEGKPCHLGGLYAINHKDGSVKWRWTSNPTDCRPWLLGNQCARDSSTDGSPAVDASGTIYLGTNNGHFIGFGPDGTKIFQINTGDAVGHVVGSEIDSPIVIDARGSVYVTHSGGPCNTYGDAHLPNCGLIAYHERSSSK